MNRLFNIKPFITAIFSIFTLSLATAQSYPVQVNSFIKPPYPTQFEDWEDLGNKIILSLTNTSGSEQEINLHLYISGPNGLTVDKRNLLTYPMTLDPHKTQSIQGASWNQYGIVLKLEDIAPESERNYVVKNRVFREGAYTICIRAVNPLSGEPMSEGSPTGCFDFNIVYGEAPQLINPLNEQSVHEQSPSMVQINWIHQVQGAPFEYTLKIVEADELNVMDINQAMNNPGYATFYEESGIKAFTKTLRNEDFKSGKRYAVRVTATDPNEAVFFKNAGHSEIIQFTYGNPATDLCSNLNSFEVTSHFPADGDTLPFMAMPLISSFIPNCKDYEQLIYTVDFNGTKNKAVNLNWPKGALEYLKTSLNDNSLTWDMASFIAFDNLSDNKLKRGESYQWTVATEVKDSDQNSYKSLSKTGKYVTGMSRPKLVSPVKGEKMAAGIIEFSFKVPQRQKQILPDYKLPYTKLNNNKQEQKTTQIQKIDEHWVIQVFSENSTSSSKLVGKNHGRIQLDTDDYYNAATHRYNAVKLINELDQERSAEIQLTKAGDYWWRVVWLKNPGGSWESISDSDIYHASSLQHFKVGLKDNPGTQDAGDCIAVCEAPQVTDKTATDGLKKDQVLKIGLFNLKVTEISKSSNKTFTGKGEIEIGFLNKMIMEVAFTDIKKNKDNQIFAGTVKAVKNSQYSAFFKKYNTYIGYAKQGIQAGINQVKQEDIKKNNKEFSNEIEKLAKSGDRLVSSLMGKKTGLPVGLDNTVLGYRLAIAITEMEFTPQKAIMQTVVDVKIPALKFDLDDSNILILRTRDICFSPNGLGTEGKAYLSYDLKLELDQDGNEIKILGGENPANIDNVTYVSWNCKGFKDINVALEYSFSRKVIVPDQTDQGRVVAKAFLKSTNGVNLIGKVTMQDFQLPFESMKGYGFKVHDAILDLSSLENPSGLKANLPANYKSSTLGNKDPRLSNTWRGFWLKKMEIQLPEYIGNVEKNTRNTHISVDNMIIDGSGFTAAFVAADLIKWEETHTKDTKHIDGCAFSLDSIYVKVVQNSLSSAGLNGKIGLPIAEKRDYLVYRGVLDMNEKKSGFRFNVKPVKNIGIPILFAKLEILNTSTFDITLGDLDKSLVDLNLNAKASIVGNPLDKDPKAKPLVNIPGVTIENLRFNSTSGIDTTKFKCSFASPQKWLAGFPASISDVQFTGGLEPKVKFTVGLSLMNSKDKSSKKEKGGFSTSATLALEGKINKDAALLKMLELKKVELKKITLDVEVSSFKMNGMLEFYDDKTKNGVRGKLTVSLPMDISAELNAEFGTVKMENAKTFDTKDWYSYWYVDGYGKIKTGGIPVFSGVNLYGLGGGVYHHMTRLTEPSHKKDNAPNIPYKPDFNTSLGLKFGAFFGSADGGKAFNFDVMIEAAFNKNHGMESFRLSGNANILSDSSNDKNSSVNGYVNLEYNNKAEAEEHVTGDLLIRVNTPLIKGASTAPAPAGYTGSTDNLFVVAKFYAKVGDKKTEHKNGYWYFNMGTPKHRGALAVDLSNKKVTKNDKDKSKQASNKLVLNFDSYLMIGHDVPVTIPPPSAAFEAIYKKAGGKTNFSGGKLDDLLNGKPRPTLAPGQGFAFGSSFSANIKANPVPFYLEVDAALGFDINMTHSDQRTCLSTNKVPGINGWYSTGQVYAGLSLGVEVKVDFLFIKGKFTVFEGAAAMIMQGGFPNPSWAAGEGHINYKILDGLLKGHYCFEFELGEKCIPSVSTAEYLANYKFIQDLKPADKSKKNEVYTSCSAAFILPVETEFVIPVEQDKVKKLKPYIHNWTLKDEKGSRVPCELIEVSKDKVSATLTPKILLNGNHNYTQELEVRVKEYLKGYWTTVLTSDKNYWAEKNISVFTTGDALKVISDEMVEFTYPLKNQRAFLKQETRNNQGYIVQRMGNAADFYETDRNYVVRFIKLDGSESYTEVPLTRDQYSKVLSFNVSGLENDTYYCLQVVGKKQTGLGDLSWDKPVNLQLSKANSTTEHLLLGGRNVLYSDIIKRKSLPGNTVIHPEEVVLYHYYFKTSKYNTLQQKLLGKAWTSEVHKGFSFERLSTVTSLDEGVETYDQKGFTTQYSTVDPLIQLTINDGTDPGFSNDNSYVQYPLNLYIQERVIGRIRVPVSKTNKVLTKSYIDEYIDYELASYQKAIEWSSDTEFLSPLTKSEMDLSNNQKPTAPGGVFSGTILGGGIETGIPNMNDGGSQVFFGGVNDRESGYVVKIYDNMPILGRSNFIRAKTEMARVLSVELPLFDNKNVPYSYNKYPDPDYWVHKYLGYPVWNPDKWNKYVKKYKNGHPTVEDFLFIFYPQEGFMAYMLAISPGTCMNPPVNNSLIIQYRYPLPYTVNKKVSMNKGTSIQISYSKY